MQHHDEFDDNSEQPVELSAPVDDHGEQHRRLRLTIPSRLDDCLLESEVFYRTISKSTTGSTTSTSIVPRRTAIIISHPYGPLGGDMHNNVVDALWETLCEVGGSSIVLRYNAR